MKYILLILWIWVNVVFWFNVCSKGNFFFSVEYVEKMPEYRLSGLKVGYERLGVYCLDDSKIIIVDTQAHSRIGASINQTFWHEVFHWIAHRFFFAIKSDYLLHRMIDKHFLL